MRHLVIGYGNMGRKHTEILRSMGDEVDVVDLDWHKGWDYGPYDSVLVCTPPNSHLNAILDVGRVRTPIFIEKPVMSDYVSFGGLREDMVSPISMVACNWRYCSCLPDDLSEIRAFYPASEDSAALDLIHFLDLFIYRHGSPEFGGVSRVKAKGQVELTLSKPDIVLYATIYHKAKKPRMWVGGYGNLRQIHKTKPCSMFRRQMIDWRECLRVGVPHTNHIMTALERTKWLIEKIDLCK